LEEIMLKQTPLFSMLSLAACTAEKTEDTGATVEAGAAPITFGMTFVDGMTSSPLEGADVCVEEPAVDDNCFVTDSDGYVEWTWDSPVESNFLGRFELEGYVTSLYSGRYADDVAENWEEQLETSDIIELSYGAFSQASVGMFLNTGGVEQESDLGQVLFFVGQGDGSGLEGVSVSVADDSGTEAGTVLYVNPMMTSLDTDLESTSTSGGVAIANLGPGIHTVTVGSPDYTCKAGFAWNSNVDNEVQVPVEAGAMTQAAMNCTAD
jgi:hypothetical protein